MELWSLTRGGLKPAGNQPWWDGRLVLGPQLLDPVTGELTEAPWQQFESVALVTWDLAITCDHDFTSPTYCTAWDSRDGVVSQRWRRELEGRHIFWLDRIAGDTATGSALVSYGQSSMATLALSDGTLVVQGPSLSSSGVSSEYLPAADGWLRLVEGQSTADLIDLKGNPLGSFELADAGPGCSSPTAAANPTSRRCGRPTRPATPRARAWRSSASGAPATSTASASRCGGTPDSL